MTTNTTLTTLQAARQYIRSCKQLHYLNMGLASLVDHLPDEEQRDQAIALHRAAHDHAGLAYDQAKREYKRIISSVHKHHGYGQENNHLWALDDIAEQYAWK